MKKPGCGPAAEQLRGPDICPEESLWAGLVPVLLSEEGVARLDGDRFFLLQPSVKDRQVRKGTGTVLEIFRTDETSGRKTKMPGNRMRWRRGLGGLAVGARRGVRETPEFRP